MMMTPNDLDKALRKLGIREPLHVGAAALGTTAASLCRWLSGIHDVPNWVPVALRGVESSSKPKAKRKASR
jgi:hypothetical protein